VVFGDYHCFSLTIPALASLVAIIITGVGFCSDRIYVDLFV